MKNALIYILLPTTSWSLQAQYSPDEQNFAESNMFSRKGSFMIETSYNVIARFSGGTGLGILSAGDDNVTSLGLDGQAFYWLWCRFGF